MHSLRRAALRSALSTPRALSTSTRIAPVATRAVAGTHSTKTLQAVRFFSQTTCRKQSEEKELEKAQLKAEEDFEKQVAEDARQDVEESIAQTEADIQEAMQEVNTSAAPEPVSQGTPVEEHEQPAQQVEQTEQQTKPQTQKPAECSAFVRNLVFEITEDHLKKAFEKYGAIKETFIARDPRGLSKGYGFVTFEDPESLNQACANVNGSFWHGRRVTCIPRAEKQDRRGSNNPNSPKEPTAQLYIGNIPYETTDAELNRLFRGLDNLKDVRVAVDRTTGWPRGFAHADFPSVEAAMEARKRLDGVTLADRRLKIDFAEGYQRKSRRND